MKNFLKKQKLFITLLISVILSILVGHKVITQEQSRAINQGAQIVLDEFTKDESAEFGISGETSE